MDLTLALKALRCAHKGHRLVDSRSRPGTLVCARCRYRPPVKAPTAQGIQPADTQGDA